MLPVEILHAPVVEHGLFEDIDQAGRVVRNDMGAQYPIVVVHHDFVGGMRHAHPPVGRPGQVEIGILVKAGARFLEGRFGSPHHGILGIGEEDRGNGPVIHLGPGAPLHFRQDILGGHVSLVVRHPRQLNRRRAVPHGKNARVGGSHGVVDLDAAPVVVHPPLVELQGL